MTGLRVLFTKLFGLSTSAGAALPGVWKPGDEWRAQAYKMLAHPLVKIRCDGCMAETETIEAEGICVGVKRVPDGAAPEDRVIWEAYIERNDRHMFVPVIVARCTWNAEKHRYEERY